MTTYERGKEPAGAPVTWRRLDPLGPPCYSLFDHRGFLVEVPALYQADAICAAFHASAEWRKLAEAIRELMRKPMDDVERDWNDRFDRMKETFGD